MKKEKRKIWKIVFTGGSCGGKTTALNYIRQKLEAKGYLVIIVPEAATLCITNGISPINPLIGSVAAQTAITGVIRQLEDIFIASTEKVAWQGDIVMLCDRGIPDALAYTSPEVYASILDGLGIHPTQARDQRYDAVLHLTTAAIGAERFYTLANNAARYETVEQARELDARIVKAWTGAPHLRIIDNSTDFEGKLRRVYAEICSVIGDPVPVERERKFIVHVPEDSLLPDSVANCQRIAISQAYLRSGDPSTVIRVRERAQNGFSTYYKTVKKQLSELGECFELEDQITGLEYGFGLELRDPATAIVKKNRHCFVHDVQYFELDVFDDARAIPDGHSLLELEITEKGQQIRFPEWVKVIREVTGDPRYSNYGIAKALAEA